MISLLSILSLGFTLHLCNSKVIVIILGYNIALFTVQNTQQATYLYVTIFGKIDHLRALTKSSFCLYMKVTLMNSQLGFHTTAGV